MLAPILEITGLGKAYDGRPVLAGVNLRVSGSGHVLVTGPSGGGKSTLLGLIAGLAAPGQGSIRIGGRLVSEAGRVLVPPDRRGLGMVFQDLGLWPNLTALENVSVGLAGLKLARTERMQRARQALEACEILHLAPRRPRSLSGGELQRVALARALAGRPAMLLLDEPFTGLDLVLKTALVQRIRSLGEQAHMTIIMASHYPADATLLGGEVAVLEGGVICEQGDFDRLCRNPASQTLKAWRAALPESLRR
jgi:ABC-type sugar transport system ATPase subunit